MAAGTSDKTIPRRYPFALAFICFVSVIYLNIFFLMLAGFPDGFLSELDRAEVQLVQIFNRISEAMGPWCIFVGIVAGRMQIRKPFFVSCALYCAAIAAALLIDLYFRNTLMDSRGG